jgi:hypothetical protein
MFGSNRKSNQMYKFSVWNFSDKEIDQIVDLVKIWVSGSTNPIDRRKYTKDVLYWATRYNLIIMGKDVKEWDYQAEKETHPWYVKKWGKNRYYTTGGSDFDCEYGLPVEALWRLTQPIFKNGKGFSTITKSKEWHNLNTYCSQDSTWDTIDEYEKEYGSGLHLTNAQTRYLPYMRKILNKLSAYGYLIFQYAGSIWQVTLTLDRAYRSE